MIKIVQQMLLAFDIYSWDINVKRFSNSISNIKNIWRLDPLAYTFVHKRIRLLVQFCTNMINLFATSILLLLKRICAFMRCGIDVLINRLLKESPQWVLQSKHSKVSEVRRKSFHVELLSKEVIVTPWGDIELMHCLNRSPRATTILSGRCCLLSFQTKTENNTETTDREHGRNVLCFNSILRTRIWISCFLW